MLEPKKLYDKRNKRIIIIKEETTTEFWDKYWEKGNFIDRVRDGKNNGLIGKFTGKFLKPGAKILESGCGVGAIVFGLNSWGYDAYGVDLAKNSIKRAKKEFPELKLFVQDIRKLEFLGDFFDGYWSVGVVEHFWEGYDDILKEAKRVIKQKGYLFLTFPYISFLRKLKAQLGMYEVFEDNLKVEDFFQFILDAKKVKADVEKYGFKLLLQYPFNATKGLKDEIFFLRPILQKIYDSQNILARGIRFLISILFSKFAGNSIFLVFKKL